MSDKVTGKDILNLVVGKLAPQQEKGVLPLLRILASQAMLPASPMQPTQSAPNQPEATMENIGASLAGESKPMRKNYNFLKGGK